MLGGFRLDSDRVESGVRLGSDCVHIGFICGSDWIQIGFRVGRLRIGSNLNTNCQLNPC